MDIVIAEIERREREAPISCVFFYAAGTHVSAKLLSYLRDRGIWSVAMGLDDKQQMPAERKGEVSAQFGLARTCDVYWTTWRTGAEVLRRFGVNVWYAPPAADPEFYRPVDAPRDLDIVFVGQAYGDRRRLVRHLRRRGIAVEARGRGWPGGPVSFEEMIELFSRAEIVLGVGGVGQMSGVKHLKGRDFEVPACGAVYLTSFNPELADHFEIGTEVFCYGSFQECEDVIRWLLASPSVLASSRLAASRRSQTAHTWELRLRQLFDLWGDPGDVP
jgi:spore maturation protein CgeB